MKEIKDYLAYQGEQYRNPEKAGAEKDKMLDLRQKGQEARKAFTRLAECFQARHTDWNLHPTSQWMNQAQRLRPHFWVYLQREGHVTEPMMALRLYGNPNNWGLSMEVSFIERKMRLPCQNRLKSWISQWLMESIIGFRKTMKAIEYKLLKRTENF